LRVTHRTRGNPRPRPGVGCRLAGPLDAIEGRFLTGRALEAPAALLIVLIISIVALTPAIRPGILAVGRIVSEPAEQGSPRATLPDTIQTSAAINPGNSGGALATLGGQQAQGDSQVPARAVAGDGHPLACSRWTGIPAPPPGWLITRFARPRAAPNPCTP
jgi:hypothetical protein